MGVTNGFLRLSRGESSLLEKDASAFEQRCRQYDHPDYLDMDKAGYELLFILDPSTVDLDNPEAESPFPEIAKVLSNGTVLHKNIDLGYGPAQRIPDEAMRASLNEFECLDYNQCYAMASTVLMSELLMIVMDEDMFRDYHWAYLQSLGQFIKDAVERDMVVLRY